MSKNLTKGELLKGLIKIVEGDDSYKGTIGPSASSPTVQALPGTPAKGDVYKVIGVPGTIYVYTTGADATLVKYPCYVGDYFVCVTEADSAAAVWNVVHMNKLLTIRDLLEGIAVIQAATSYTAPPAPAQSSGTDAGGSGGTDAGGSGGTGTQGSG